MDKNTIHYKRVLALNLDYLGTHTVSDGEREKGRSNLDRSTFDGLIIKPSQLKHAFGDESKINIELCLRVTHKK